jgi:hypothetical protein
MSLGTYVAPKCKSQYRSTSTKSSHHFEVNHGGPTTPAIKWPPQPLIQSWWQKVVEGYMSLLDGS